MMDEVDDTQAFKQKLKNILMTDRDFEVCLSLYENVVMTFSQVAGRHFANNKKPTVMNRLARLELAGLIRRERIPKMRLGLDDHAVGVVFQITKNGISELSRRYPTKEFKRDPIRLHPYTLHHDLILVDVMSQMKSRWPTAEIVNGKYLFQNGLRSKGLEPDLVWTCPDTNVRTAIELELSDKSESRYREIVLRYRIAKEYDRVLYFTGRPFIRELMTKVILNRVTHKEETPETGKFFFADAFQFLKDPAATPITNGKINLLTIGDHP
jgi:DNA-binding Lrp family transcriptional regulator